MAREVYKLTEIGEIPEEWEVTRLENVVNIYDNKRIPLSEEQRKNKRGNYPYCGANGIIDYIDDFIFDGEYVLLAEDGGHWRKFENSVYIMSGKFWVNNHAHIIQAKDGTTINSFLMYYLNLADLTQYITGSTRGKMNQSRLRSIKLPLPLLPEQKKIAEILSTVDGDIRKTDEIITKTQELKKGMMQQLLAKGIGHTRFKKTEIGEIPKDWEVVRLEHVIGVKSGEYFKLSEFCEKGIMCLKIDNVGFGKVIWNTITFLPKEYLFKYSELILNEGDIVMALNRPIIDGKLKIGILKKDDCPSILYQRVGKIIFKNGDGLNNQYLFFVFTGRYFKQQLSRSLVGTDQPYIRNSLLLKIKIPLPPLLEQRKIAEILSTIDEKIEIERKRKEKLEELKKGLMQNLLTGEVRVKIDQNG